MKRIATVILLCFVFVFSTASFANAGVFSSLAAFAGICTIENDAGRALAGGALGSVSTGVALSGVIVSGSLATVSSTLALCFFGPAVIAGGLAVGTAALLIGD